MIYLRGESFNLLIGSIDGARIPYPPFECPTTSHRWPNLCLVVVFVFQWETPMTENRRREDSNVFDQVVRILATKAAGLGFSKQYMVSENRLIKAQGIVWRGFNVLWRLRNLWIHINRILEGKFWSLNWSSLLYLLYEMSCISWIKSGSECYIRTRVGTAYTCLGQPRPAKGLSRPAYGRRDPLRAAKGMSRPTNVKTMRDNKENRELLSYLLIRVIYIKNYIVILWYWKWIHSLFLSYKSIIIWKLNFIS